MTALSNHLMTAPKFLRVLLLGLLLILLCVLVAYVTAPFLLLELAPVLQAATTSTAPEPTAALAETPSPTPMGTPGAAGVQSPSPTPSASPTPSPSLSPTVELPAGVPCCRKETETEPATAEAGGAVQALDEQAGPSNAPGTPGALVADATITASPTSLPAAVGAATSTRTSAAAAEGAATHSPRPASAAVISTTNIVHNGSFSGEFQDNGVATGWDHFNNGGAEFSYNGDLRPSALGESGRTQVMRVRNAAQPDRYLGIYQTVSVVPGRVYTFSISGLVRTNTGDSLQTGYGYRLQIGFDTLGDGDWKQVSGWIELPWDEQLQVQDTHRIDVYTTTVYARSNRLSVFVRAWKKWADGGEGAYDISAIRLIGPAELAPVDVESPGMPVTGQTESSFLDNLRVWITLVLLAVLLGGAVWRSRSWPKTYCGSPLLPPAGGGGRRGGIRPLR